MVVNWINFGKSWRASLEAVKRTSGEKARAGESRHWTSLEANTARDGWQQSMSEGRSDSGSLQAARGAGDGQWRAVCSGAVVPLAVADDGCCSVDGGIPTKLNSARMHQRASQTQPEGLPLAGADAYTVYDTDME